MPWYEPTTATRIQNIDLAAQFTPLDWRARLLKNLIPARDLPGVFAWWDASRATGTNGSLVSALGDEAGQGNGVYATGTARPTLNVGALNGLNTMTFSSANLMATASGITVWDAPVRAQPLTYVMLVKYRSAGTTTQARSCVTTTGSGNASGIAISATVSSASGYSSWAYPYAGGQGLGGGAGLNDDTWHVIIVRMNATGSTVLTDGRVTQAATTAGHGTGGAAGRIILGAFNTVGALPMDGDFAEGGCIQGELSLKNCEHITEYLRAKWNYGPTYTPKQETVLIEDRVDANGQAYRVFRTPTLSSATPPLLVFNHQQAGTTGLQPGLAGFTIARAAAIAGWVVVIPNNHGGDSWSSAAAVADGPAAEAAITTALGITGFSKVVLVGQSMGGLLSAVQAKLAFYTAPLRGVYMLDAALNLKWAYNSSGYKASLDIGFGIVAGSLTAASAANATTVTSSVSFVNGTAIVVDPTGTNPEYVTTSAISGSGPYTFTVTPALSFAHASGALISDYPTKTAGRDPILWTAAQVPVGLRWRMVASSNDPTVSKAQCTDMFKPILDAAGANVLEDAVISHPGGHLEVSAYRPDDFEAFLNRCV